MNRNSMAVLSKLAKRNPAEELPVYRLAVVGDCSTQHLSQAIRGTGIIHDVNIEIFDADYDQISAQIDDSSSELYSFAPDGVFIMMCTEKLYSRYLSTRADERVNFAQNEYGLISRRWNTLAGKTKSVIIQSLFCEYDDRVFGSFACRLPGSFIYQLRRLNMLISEGAAAGNNVYPVDFSFLASEMGYMTVKSPIVYGMAKLPFSTEYIPQAAEAVVNIILALKGKSVKCIILDLDDTLWGGTVSEDGMEGIQIGELGTGYAFSAIQTYMKELKNRGILLAVCSKNYEDKAKEPFLKHPDMILRLEDFALFVANWKPKAENIRYIQSNLNIGMDSLVFIDNSPFERAAVRAAIPEITVPEMPEDPAEYVNFLRRENLFEAVSYTPEDAGRTLLYRAEAGRRQAEKDSSTYEDFLRSLDMHAECDSFSSFWYPRIAQLSQRSNQFNLRTVRYTEADIERIARDSAYITRYFVLHDSFGDSGLISAFIMHPCDEESLFVESWFMSCRVLKRTMEEFIVNAMISAARRAGYKKVIGEYIPTSKNAMVSNIYSKLGFTDLGNGRFEADVASFVKNETFIGWY